MYSKMICGFWRKRSRMSEEEDEDDHTIERNWRQESPEVLSSQSRIRDLQETKRKTLICQTERVCGSEKARNNAVLARLGLCGQQGPHPRRLPTGPRHTSESFCNNWTSWTPRHQQKQKTHYVKENLKMNWHEVPPLPSASQPRRRLSRIPVMLVNLSGQDKEVAGGIRLQTASHQVEAIREGLKHFYGNSLAHLPSPPGTGKTHTVVPVTPAPPPNPSQLRRRETPRSTNLRPAKIVNRSRKTEDACTADRTDNQTPERLQPLWDPVDSLTHCLKLLRAKEWEKKLEGLRGVQALAQHHPDTLTAKLHDVCLAVTVEVKSLRSSVACTAMHTLVCLYMYLQKNMDPQAERSSHALLLKIAQSSANAFIQQQANAALEAMVLCCSPGRVLNALLNTGLCHLSTAVRASTAQQLHLLADKLGADAILTAGKSFTKRFLTAVSKMSLDAAAEVRTHGHAILQDLVQHGDFMKLWKKTIEEKDRRPLGKILKNVMQK
ncbi:TOG array regulator of axonemal microtubules protein 2-like [Anabas testudineus]|uniref:TOG array regulator of axonemal microtubules protein 2-like n=1 Tax=Anabas testudineus TaxID=64144 RepID=UPI000E458D83|nr:TOG array regulator of axonemal microtubules protein 2-like [Anabas testudineus]